MTWWSTGAGLRLTDRATGWTRDKTRLMRGEALKGHLELIVLASLEASPGHGYALIRDLHRRTGGTLDLTEGTIYPVLHRLEESRHLESEIVPTQSRRRRVYKLTPAGKVELERLRNEWRQFVRGVQSVLNVDADV